MAHLTYLDILQDKAFTVRGMPWIALADAAAIYQGAAQADVRECFTAEWLDDDGTWATAHDWRA